MARMDGGYFGLLFPLVQSTRAMRGSLQDPLKAITTTSLNSPSLYENRCTVRRACYRAPDSESAFTLLANAF